VRENLSLLADFLTLLGAFFLGFVVGVFLPPLQRFVSSIWHAPGQFAKGARNVGDRLRQAFKAASEEPMDRAGWSGALAGTVFDLMTLRVRHAEASFREGIAAFDEGRHGQAQRRLTQAILWDGKQELKPLHVLAHLRLGWLHEERGALAEAREHYSRAVRLDTDNLSATLNLGMIQFRLGETGPAISQFQRALELDPANLDTHYYLYAIYREAGMEREAIEQLRILKAGDNSRVLVELFSSHAEDGFRLGRYPDAASDYELALQLDPARVQLYVNLGDLYYLRREPITALETWSRGLWIEYSEALAERLVRVGSQHEDIWPVVTLLRDCLSRHSRDGRYYSLLRRLLRQAKQDSESQKLLEEAARLSPELLDVQVELGDMYSEAGQEEQAKAAYRAGLVAARANEKVYRCRVCGYVSREEQARCFECNRWGTTEGMTRSAVEEYAVGAKRLVARAAAVRQSLGSVWGRITRQLPSGR
jgi:tetratricopeptide (TPR) repeat protein